ncbi:putative membrane protein [Desulfitispora alkaliphila]|uniref:hypothetical protein n=1 Tax=Desulfitispora alkaliphila TaxID=622674 RepID=UPI003D24C54C
MEDRFVQGSIAGLIAGIAMNIVNLILVMVFSFGEDLLVNYAAEMLLGSTPGFLFEYIISFVAHIVWTMLLGILFAYMILIVDSSYMLYKSWFFSITTWFLLYSVGILFEVPLLEVTSVSTATSNMITSSVYGLLLGYIFMRLSHNPE